jgi:dihydroorotate dehydrogenase
MSLVPYALARRFLFSLDPELAHDLTLRALAGTQGTPLQLAYRTNPVDDPITLAGLNFPNRVGLAAGLDKNARCIDALGALGFGFVEVGTVTPLAQSGNAKPRLFRLPQAQALINRMGFNNEGLDTFIRNVRHSALHRQRENAAVPMLLGLNIGKNAATPIADAIDDYLTALSGVYPYADYVAVNISSPNTRNLRSLQNDEALDRLLEALAGRRQALATQYGKLTPLFVKIAPDLNQVQIGTVAAALKRHGMDGVIATNTTLERDAVKELVHGGETGGLSGAPLLQPSNVVVTQLRAALGPDFPIIGVGGIMSAQDAVSKIRAGADLVQIYTGLIYHGPALVSQAAQLIKKTF